VSVTRDDLIKLTLPRTWFDIPLGESAQTAAAIRELVQRSIGRADERAQLRADVRARTTEAVAEAERANAIGFWVAIEVRAWRAVAGVRDALSPVERRRRRNRRLTGRGDGRAYGGLRHSGLAETGRQLIGSTATPTLRMDCRVPRPDGVSILKITISAPMIEQSELFVSLFDAMVDSIVWN